MIDVTTTERTAAEEMQEDIQKWIDKQIPVATILSVMLQGAASLAKNKGFAVELFIMLATTQFGFIFNDEQPKPGLLS